MFILASVLTNLILAVSLILAAAVAGLMAYHYAKARILERTGYTFDPETETVEADSVGMENRAKSAEEIAQIRARIEALMEQQQMSSETQNQQLGQKLDEIRTHMGQQDAKMDGLKGELRHEIRRRDSELGELRQQLSTALDSFWKSMPEIAEQNAPADTRVLPSTTESEFPVADTAFEELDSSLPLNVDEVEAEFDENRAGLDAVIELEETLFMDSDPGFPPFVPLEDEAVDVVLEEADSTKFPPLDTETIVSDFSPEPEEATFAPVENFASVEPKVPSASIIEPRASVDSEPEPSFADFLEPETASISPITHESADQLINSTFEPHDGAPAAPHEEPSAALEVPEWEPLSLPTEEVTPHEELPSEVPAVGPVGKEPVAELEVPTWEPLSVPIQETTRQDELPSEMPTFVPMDEEPAAETEVPTWEPLSVPIEEMTEQDELPSEMPTFVPLDEEPAAEMEVPTWEPLSLTPMEEPPHEELPLEMATLLPNYDEPTAEIDAPAWEPLTLPSQEAASDDKLSSEIPTLTPLDDEPVAEFELPAWEPLTLPLEEATTGDELPSEIGTFATNAEEPISEVGVPSPEPVDDRSDEAALDEELPSEMTIFTPVEFAPFEPNTESVEENHTFEWKPLELPEEEAATEETPVEDVAVFAPIEFSPLGGSADFEGSDRVEIEAEDSEAGSQTFASVESGTEALEASSDTMPPYELHPESEESASLASQQPPAAPEVFSGIFDQPQAPDAEPDAPEEVVWTNAAAWIEPAAADAPVAHAGSEDMAHAETLNEEGEDETAASESSTPFVQHVVVSPSGDSISTVPDDEIKPNRAVPAEASRSILDAASLFTGSPSFDAPEETEEPEAAVEPEPEPEPEVTAREQLPEDRPPVATEKPVALHTAHGDNLTVISSITEDIQQKLYELGITKLDEMARWSRADARRVSAQVNVSEEMIMHQWIFEAQSVLFDSFQDRMARQTGANS